MTTIVQDAPQAEQQHTQAIVQPPEKNCISVWYHEADLELVKLLDLHLQSLYRRLEPQVTRNYFRYPVAPPVAPEPYTGDSDYLKGKYQEAQARYENELETYQKKHDAAIGFLEHCSILFVPLVTNAFMKALHLDMEQNMLLRTLLEQPGFPIMPILMQPTEGVPSAANALSAYAEGHDRELACVQIAAMIEGVVINSGHYQPEKTPLTPQAALFSSSHTIQAVIPSPQQDRTIEAITTTFAPVKIFLEQASTQIVEAHQLALAERSQRLESEKALEQINEKLATIEAEQHKSFFARMLSRWFSPVQSK